ncbi:unnamed protein product [Arctia plantaginis]|uniref:lysoplasmalogenase n=1 Tax=Arctia plantaginis TaxID=874455 RepID=A0A8S0ZJA3_ARCPL|nr:unnamed protein product [Arctia plantaginis]
MVSRLGVGGRLVPFFKCVCVYFLALGAGGDGSPSPGAVAAKCAPVLCLLLVVVLHVAATPSHKAWYARWVAVGLALSMLGDALLVWPQHFVAGMAAFGSAHVAYLAAFGFEQLSWRVGLGLYAATTAYLSCVSPPAGLRVLVPAYAWLLATMTWRGTAKGHKAAVGSLLFLVSDAFLGYSLFGGPVPYKQVLVMSTYYLGQLGIALSALEASA